jgi:hypothetical protein
MSKEQRLYAWGKLPDGRLVKIPIRVDQAASKLGRKMHRDIESGLWLYKQKYEYQDKKNLDESKK